jgi:hypothetical protein
VRYPEDLEQTYKLCYDRFKPIMQKYLNISKEIILKHLGEICISIYLIGSFGRDEGALYCENGFIKPIRDFDILVITVKPVAQDIIRTITEEIHEKLDLPSPTKSVLEDFSIWITYVTISDLLIGVPLLKYYELKTASKHLHNTDIRNLINIELADLSLYNGILILFTKVHGLLSLYPFSLELQERILNYVYELIKTYTEISTVFSLLDRSIYKPTFYERCAEFHRVYSIKLPGLFKLIPELNFYMPFICKRRKLLDHRLLNNLDLNVMSIHVTETLDKIIALYMKMGYGINTPIQGFSKSSNNVLSRIGIVTLGEFFSSYLRKRGVHQEPLAKIIGLLLAAIYTQYSNIVFFIKARKEGLPVKSRLIFSMRNNFVYMTYVGINLMETLAYNDKDKLEAFEELFLKKYLDSNYIKRLKDIKNLHRKKRIIVKLVTRLLRLADISLHRKAF